MISRRFSHSLPIEADPLDWADQQHLEFLPEDDYPHATELEEFELADLFG
jgi:hypothetical protein